MSQQELEALKNPEVLDNSQNGLPEGLDQNGTNHQAHQDWSEKDPPSFANADLADLPKAEASPKAEAPRRKYVRWVIVGVVLAVILGLAGLRFMTAAKPDKAAGGKGDKREQVTPVAVATVAKKTVPIQLQAIGTVQAASTVSVTPQVGGQITGVHFKKGQEVRQGDLLFTIDSRTQNAALQQAEGVLARDRAQIQQARATLERDIGLVRLAEATLAKDLAQAQFAQAQSNRYADLYKQGAISQDQAQQYTTNSRVAEATLQADREAIANAQAVVEGDRAAIANAEAVLMTDEGALQAVQVQSSYTEIYAPIDGRAGNILVTQGNVVQANSANPLVTITQTHPIQVAFSIPEANLPDIQKRMRNGKLKVDVTFAGSDRPISGTLTFINNTVDNTTGTIQLIGDFNNVDGKLFPGQFVNTTLTLAQEVDAIVVPSQAVQNGPDGQFVFVVVKNDQPEENPGDKPSDKPNDKPSDKPSGKASDKTGPTATVRNVPVVARSTVKGLSVIQGDVKVGDQVVIDGQANLIDGSKISLKPPGGGSRGNGAEASPDASGKPGNRPGRGQNNSADASPAPDTKPRRPAAPGVDAPDATDASPEPSTRPRRPATPGTDTPDAADGSPTPNTRPRRQPGPGADTPDASGASPDPEASPRRRGGASGGQDAQPAQPAPSSGGQ